MTQDNIPLCYAPFLGLYATGYGDYAPCCVSSKVELDMPAKDYWNSDELKSIRSSLLKNEWPKSCSLCERNHRKGITSEIDFWNKLHKKMGSIPINIENGNTNQTPLYLDYRPTNHCNLKCRMCVPNASSQIEQEVNLHPELSIWRKPHNRSLKYIDELTDYLGDIPLQSIKILGGEPTLDGNVISLLEKVIEYSEKNNTELPILRFTTNGTTLNHRFRRIMDKFNQIHVCYSVDAVGETYDYIRTNANWNVTKKQIEENFNRRLSHADVSGFNVVIMPYNQFALNDLLDWLYSLHLSGHTNFYISFYDSDIHYTSMSAIYPDDMKQFIERTENWISNCNDQTFINKIGSLVPLLKSVSYDTKSNQDFIKYSAQLDEIRNTKLINLDARFEKYT